MLLFKRNPQIISNYFLKKYLCSDVFQVLINETYYRGCSKKKSVLMIRFFSLSTTPDVSLAFQRENKWGKQ